MVRFPTIFLAVLVQVSPGASPGERGASTTIRLDSVSVGAPGSGSAGRAARTNAAAPLLITTSSPLPSAELAYPFYVQLDATGGTPPCRWSLSSGSLPPGLNLSSTDGVINGTPTARGSFNFTIRVSDSAQPPATDSKPLSLAVGMAPPPGMRITGLAATAEPAKQPQFSLTLDSDFPLELTGRFSLSFAPDASNAAADPAIKFVASGNTNLTFRIPAGSRQVEFQNNNAAFQTGTTAGVITLRLAGLQAGGTDISPLPSVSQATRVNRSAPVIRSARLVRRGGSMDLILIGFSTPRDMTKADFSFTAASGKTLQTTSLTANVDGQFGEWYRSATSAGFGTEFTLTIVLAITGDATAVGSVAATLENSQGRSAPAEAR
jgi:hypothetical protein